MPELSASERATALRQEWRRSQIQVSQCSVCQRWRGDGTCTAFPEGVPIRIQRNESDHRKPFPQREPRDRGLRWLGLDEETGHPLDE